MPNRFTWLPLSALLVSCGKGAPSPEAGKQADPVVAPEAAAAPADSADEAPQDAQPGQRVSVAGEITVAIDGADKRFVVSADGKSHLVDAGPMKSLVLIAQPESDAETSARLSIAIRGYDLRKAVGQALTMVPRGRAKMPRRASVSYLDEQGTRFSAIVGKGPPFELRLTAYDHAQHVEGTFSGTLVERDGERTIEVRDGTFTLRLERTTP